MKKREIEEAAIRLVSMKEMLQTLRGAFADIIAIAKHEDAHGLAFSALMIQESIDSFSGELSAFIAKKISEK